MKGLLALLLSVVYVVYVVGQPQCPTSDDFIIYNGITPELTINATNGDVLLCGNKNLCTYLTDANTWTAEAGLNPPSGIFKTVPGSFFAEGTSGPAAIFDGISPAKVLTPGNKFLFYGNRGAIRAGSTDASAAGTASFSAIGSASAAFGVNSIASGTTSTAFGYQNTASGQESTAFGYQTTASDYESTSFGYATTASGEAATAFGQNTTASGQAATAFGQNTTATNTSAVSFGKDTISTGGESLSFGLDANTANTTASTLLTPLKTDYPGAPATTEIPAYVGPSASGQAATAFGLSTYATGVSSTAWGFGTYAEGIGSTAFGTQGQAEGYDSTTWGLRNYALGDYSTAFGLLTTAQAARSTSFGYETVAQFADSTAFGYGSVAQGLESTAMGVNSYAKVYSQLVVGSCNVEPPNVTNIQSEFNANLTAFTVGIGEARGFNCTTVSDAFSVFRNGDVIINRNIYFNYGADPFAATGPATCGCISTQGASCEHGCAPLFPTLPGKKRDAEIETLKEEVADLKREIAELKKLILKA